MGPARVLIPSTALARPPQAHCQSILCKTKTLSMVGPSVVYEPQMPSKSVPMSPAISFCSSLAVFNESLPPMLSSESMAGCLPLDASSPMYVEGCFVKPGAPWPVAAAEVEGEVPLTSHPSDAQAAREMTDRACPFKQKLLEGQELRVGVVEHWGAEGLDGALARLQAQPVASERVL